VLLAATDISDADSVAAFAKQVHERYGRCDVLLACAGIYRSRTSPRPTLSCGGA